MTEQQINQFNPNARGFYQHPSLLIGIRNSGWIRWYRPDTLQETGSTRTPDGAEYVRVKE